MMNSSEMKLKEAAESGCIDDLYSIIRKDPFVLDRINQVPFVDTPLHSSASVGQIRFSLEIMSLKPAFAKKLNPDGFTPMHLAVQNNQTQMVFQLMDVDIDLVSVRGRSGLTPFHIAASGGRVDILVKFLASCPQFLKVLTICRESAFHIAVKNGNLESFEVMFDWHRRSSQSFNFTNHLSCSDDEGNNILHLAALTDQIEILYLLIGKVCMRSKNFEGLSALDIMEEQGLLEDEELKEMVNRHNSPANSNHYSCESPKYSGV